ncbi:putative secreted protein (Por secretion system target) [Marinilabilia salmonicolor]|jgi:hypothetical protein|uniref:T9SS type A sorting domain-containing protein n=1 Tax=Marinilabilia salmonicolor TaxID=989 RepID=UPI000D0754E4|nr:T9SS type A sorting domain-containing protein [Marinilabilia salmonicolor]PRY96421.1 putative secreted protein (Por secretion system target) [Marinilabilia salmonicolor]
MKKFLLTGMIAFFAVVFAFGQEAQLPFYPTFRYDNWNNNGYVDPPRPNGFVKVVVVSGAADGKVMNRVDITDLASSLDYAMEAEQRALTSTSEINGVHYSTDVYAITNPLIIPNNTNQEIQVSFWNRFRYSAGDYVANRQLLVTKNLVFETDGTTPDAVNTSWVNITPNLAAEDAGWINDLVVLPSEYQGQTIYLAFRYQYDINNSAYSSIEDRPGKWEIAELKVTEVADGTTVPTSISSVERPVEQLLSPNPVARKLLLGHNVSSCSIYNMSGHQVKWVSDLSAAINVSDLVDGIYIVRMEMQDGATRIGKFLKQ